MPGSKPGSLSWDMVCGLQSLTVHHGQNAAITGYIWTARLLPKDHVQASYAIRGVRDNPETE